jgi:hypothetical protein
MPFLVFKPINDLFIHRVKTPASRQAVGRVKVLTFAIDQEPYHLASALLWKNASYAHQAAHFPARHYRIGDQAC